MLPLSLHGCLSLWCPLAQRALQRTSTNQTPDITFRSQPRAPRVDFPHPRLIFLGFSSLSSQPHPDLFRVPRCDDSLMEWNCSSDPKRASRERRSHVNRPSSISMARATPWFWFYLTYWQDMHRYCSYIECKRTNRTVFCTRGARLQFWYWSPNDYFLERRAAHGIQASSLAA